MRHWPWNRLEKIQGYDGCSIGSLQVTCVQLTRDGCLACRQLRKLRLLGRQLLRPPLTCLHVRSRLDTKAVSKCVTTMCTTMSTSHGTVYLHGHRAARYMEDPNRIVSLQLHETFCTSLTMRKKHPL